MEIALFPILPLPLYVLLPALLLLLVPYKLPRAGAIAGVVIAVLGLVIFVSPASQDAFFRDLFEAINRALGSYLMIYGGLWAAIGGTRWWAKRRPAAVPV